MSARWEFAAIGTSWSVDTDEPLSAAARAAVESIVDAFDRTWSRFRADSVVTEFARRPGTRPAPPDSAAMLELYDALSTATGGAVNPLVGDSLARRGYDPSYGLVDQGAVGAPADWRDILVWNEELVSLTAPATIDVGAVGKGRLVDLVLAELVASGATGIVVDASGDLAVRGRVERIGLEHPYDPTRAIGVWTLQHGALCASAVNRRAWGDGLHHVLDARTGEPVRSIAATWAVAADAMTADAAATALFFEGGAEFAFERRIQWVRMTSDGRLEWSPDCKAELFS